MPFKAEFFLAYRYLKPQKSLITLLTYLSLLGPMLGVAVLLIVTSVMNGLPKASIEAIKEYTPHICIKSPKPLSNADALVLHIEEKYKLKASPAVPLKVFLQKDNEIKPFSAKGIYPNKDKSFTEIKNLWGSTVQKDYQLGTDEVLLSTRSGLNHNFRIGDKILLISPEKTKALLKHQANGEKRFKTNAAKEFTIAGFYIVKDRRIDQETIILHQDDATELLDLNWGDALQIDIKLPNPDSPDAFIEKLKNDPQFKDLSITSWKSNIIYQRIAIEKSQMTLVVFLILAAAAVGIGACIFSLVIQKTKEIGILKATGAHPLTVVLIFLSQGAFIGIIGSTIGFFIGLTVLENRTKIASFLGKWDANLSRLQNIPVSLDPTDIQIILWGSIGICLLAATVPAIIAASINPVKALQSGN